MIDCIDSSKKVLFPFTTKNFSLKSWNKHRYTINISSDTFCRCTMIEFCAYTNTYLHEVIFGNLYKYNNTKWIHMSCNIALLFHFNNQMISYLKKSRVKIKSTWSWMNVWIVMQSWSLGYTSFSIQCKI